MKINRVVILVALGIFSVSVAHAKKARTQFPPEPRPPEHHYQMQKHRQFSPEPRPPEHHY